MVESTALLKRRGGKTPPRVRIPPSPLKLTTETPGKPGVFSFPDRATSDPASSPTTTGPCEVIKSRDTVTHRSYIQPDSGGVPMASSAEDHLRRLARAEGKQVPSGHARGARRHVEESTKWYAYWREGKKQIKVPLFTDKDAAQAMMTDLLRTKDRAEGPADRPPAGAPRPQDRRAPRRVPARDAGEGEVGEGQGPEGGDPPGVRRAT